MSVWTLLILVGAVLCAVLGILIALGVIPLFSETSHQKRGTPESQGKRAE